MDIAISIVAGLSLRTFLVGKNVAFVWLSPAVIGAFEGVVVHQLSSRSNSEVDHFLAFGLRLIIDHLLSGDTSRTVMIVVWTAIGFITSEVVTPRTTLEPLPPIKRERSERRYRSSRTTGTSSRIRAYQSPTSTDTLLTRARTTPTPVIPTRLPGLRPSNTPRIPVHRPPSPQAHSFEMDQTPYLPFHHLYTPSNSRQHGRPPLAVCLEADSGGSTPSPKGVLPTPPQSAPSENVDYTTRETGSPRRLSTIQEISSDQEMSPRTRRTNSGSRALEPEVPVQPPPPPSQPAVAAPAPSGSRPSQSGASSEKGNHTRPGSPLPVPNLTLDGFALSQPFKPDDEIQHITPYSQTMQSAPVPVPNLTTSNWQPCAGSQAAQEDGDLLSPLSDGPEFGARHARNPQDPPTEELLSPLSDGPEFGASHSRGASAPPRTPDPDDLLSPVSEGEEFDELRTPPPRGYKRGTSGKGKGKASSSNIRVPQEISDDPLRTPPELRSPEAFSPLLVDEPLASGSKTPPARLGSTSTSHTRTFGNPTGFQPFAAIDTGFDLDLEPPSIPGSMPSPVAPLPPQGDQNDDDEAHGGPPSDPETVLSNATSILSTRSPTKLTQKAEKLRKDARNLEKDLQFLRHEYQKAMREKRVRDALTLKGEIAELEEEAKLLHKRAAKRYFASLNDFNPKRREHTIDVHGLRPSEALEKTEKALLELLKSGHSTLRVIVGKGLHSVNGQPVLKGAITAAMQRQKIPCEVDPKNTGVLIVELPKS